MEWLNLHASTMDSPEFVGSDTKERGTWLSLLRYCIGQENGGTISGCKLWRDRQWQQLARVTLREVSSDCRLYAWSSQDLIVWGYPKEKESEVCRKRELARLNGKTGGRPKVGSETITNKEPTLVISPKAEGNGMEGEWKEKGESVSPSAQPTKKNDLTDADWLKSLAADPAYSSVSIQAEFSKMSRWCEVNRKQATRRRFVNWINRIEKPINGRQQTYSEPARISKNLFNE